MKRNVNECLLEMKGIKCRWIGSVICYEYCKILGGCIFCYFFLIELEIFVKDLEKWNMVYRGN